MRHKARKPTGLGRYATGQKRCHTCDLFMEWSGIWCPCCGRKLRTRPRNAEYESKLNSSNPVTHQNGRERNNIPIVSTSTSTCDEHATSKSDTVAYGRLPPYEKMLVHEHNFVHDLGEKGKDKLRCLTCSTYYCEICGKVLDDTVVHTAQSWNPLL
jgi:hypothetical protein